MDKPHPYCDRCWYHENPNDEPIRLRVKDRSVEPCCRCGMHTASGIYVSQERAALPLCRCPLVAHALVTEQTPR